MNTMKNCTHFRRSVWRAEGFDGVACSRQLKSRRTNRPRVVEKPWNPEGDDMSHDFEDVTESSAGYGRLDEIDRDVEAALRRQDEALALLERLRAAEPFAGGSDVHPHDERRGFRRWATPSGVTLELHDGKCWHRLHCPDIGVGGARTDRLPAWADGPTPVRVKALGHAAVIALADVMWRDTATGMAGLRFEFQDAEERDYWTESLVDALLSSHAVG